MSDEKPLYQDSRIKVDYLPDCHEDHGLAIDEGGERGAFLVLQRGVLEELARTNRDGLPSKITTMNSIFLYALERTGLTLDAIHVAICQARMEEVRRYLEVVGGIRVF